jgi:predicted NACHT family NTPase
MDYNWELIKKEIIRETKDVFQAQPYFKVSETVDLFEKVLFYPLNDPNLQLDGLSNLVSVSLYQLLVEDTKDKSIYFSNAVKVEQYLRKILYLTNQTKYNQLESEKKGLLAFIDELDLNPNRINYNWNKLHSHQKTNFAEHLLSTYKLRNTESHRSEDYSKTEILNQLKSALVIYLYATYQHFNALESIIEKESILQFSAYINTVKTNFQNWHSRFVHIEGKEEFEEISLYARETDWDISDNVDVDEETRVRREGKIEDLRKQSIKEKQFQMIIVGDAGMGKSTTMQYLSYQDACNKSIRLPMYIELKLLTSELNIKEYICNKFGFDLRQLNELLQQGKATLFLDGLNEILLPIKQGVFIQIKNLIKDYPKTFILLSTRPQDYKNDFIRVPVFALQRMKDDQINEFLQKNTKNEKVREQIANAIANNERWKKILSTPLMLYMLIQVVTIEGEIPNDENKIILRFIENLYQRERQKDHLFNIDYFHIMLCYLAFESIESKGNTNSALNFSEVESIFHKKDQTLGTKEIMTILKKATELNILAEDDMVYSFAHQSYQETLAGDYLNTLYL